MQPSSGVCLQWLRAAAGSNAKFAAVPHGVEKGATKGRRRSSEGHDGDITLTINHALSDKSEEEGGWGSLKDVFCQAIISEASAWVLRAHHIAKMSATQTGLCGASVGQIAF